MRTKLPKLVRRLGWISLFTDISSEMVYPIVPLFLAFTLKAPVLALGVIEGVAEGIVSLMKGFSGWHSDRIGKRVVYVRWGYGLASAAKPFLALAFHWPLVLVARSMDRFGKGLRTSARDAMIADVTPKEDLGRAFGFHRSMDTSGALIGVLASAGLLFAFPGRYRWIFLLAAIPAAAAVFLTFRLKEPAPKATAKDRTAEEKIPFSRDYYLVLGLFLLFSLANSSDTFLLLRTKQTGLTDAETLLVYALYNITYAVSCYPAGALSDRFGRWKLIAMGWAVYTAVYAGFAHATSANVGILFAIYGIYMGVTQGAAKALIVDHAPKSRMGTAIGIFHMSSGFTTIIASALAGFLWDFYTPRATFYFGSGVALLSLILIPVVKLFGPKRTASSDRMAL